MIRSALTWDAIDAMSADEAASLWLVRFDAGVSAGDRDLFERWLNASADNARAWNAAEAGWELFSDSGQADELREFLEEARATDDVRSGARSWGRPIWRLPV